MLESTPSQTQRVEQGTVVLAEGSSSVVSDSGLRVSTGNVFSTFARIRASTDGGECEALLDVGESLVFSNRLPGDTYYSEWYEVVLADATAGEAVLDWSVGTGLAPPVAQRDPCV